VLRVRLFFTVAVGVVVLVGSARAQNAEPPGALSVLSLPGGLRGALAATDDLVAADRSQFLLEFIRRTYHAPIGVKSDPRDVALRSLLAHLDRSSRQSEQSEGSAETLPLPLPAAIWIDVVFGGRATEHSLLSDILRSRSAALFYYALLSLDDDTRSWLATQPDLIAELASQRSTTFLVAAPGLRVAGNAVRVPGGDLAEPAWRALVGRRATEPAGFVRALLTEADGRLAYFFGAMGQLTPAQVRLAFNLESPDVAHRVAAARRLYAVFDRIAAGWKIEERTFWRPALDPALLVADLRVNDDGRAGLPGTRRFWNAVFADGDQGRPKPGDEDAFAEGEPVDVAWLCEQIFKGEPIAQRRRYHLVLFASRVVGRITPALARDAIDAVRAAGRYPALVAVLERAKLVDVAAFASAARRAARLSAIDDDTRAVRAIAQFQGALALVTRAALRRNLSADSVANVVSSLSAVDVNDQGDYEGHLVRWLVDWLDAHAREAPSPTSNAAAMLADSSVEMYAHTTGLPGGGGAPPLIMDWDMFRMLSGAAAGEPRFVEWEGTRYRLDLARAEAVRLARLLGEHPRPYLSSARALVIMADALSETGLTRERLRQQADRFEQVARAVALEGTDRYREVALELRRLARDGDVRGAPRLAPALRVIADALLARGLMGFAYAAALGHPDRVAISAGDAASRHDFALRSGGAHRPGAWQLSAAGSDVIRGWRVTGSLLGLDVSLAEFSLVSLSSRPPVRKPSLTDADRRVLVDAVALVEPASLVQADADAIVAAIKRGRARLAAVRRPIEAVVLADEIRLGPIRRTLLPWVVVHQPERVAAFLSPSELFWLGLEKRPIDVRLHAWGAPGGPRLGCLCLQLIDRRPWETLAGRWTSGIFASAFPDLNLRLAELLTELRMPAPLLGPVLGPATLDFINTATSRDQDDRRGLVEFVQALGPDRVEQYLALLTTDGPLVPIGEAAAPTAVGAGRKEERKTKKE
jgi:hypothetical protein